MVNDGINTILAFQNKLTNKSYSLLILLCCLILLSSCATSSKECRGYPFDKQFPDELEYVWVGYDEQLKMLYDVDGLGITTTDYRRSKAFPRRFTYNEFFVEHSPREKEYIAAYNKMEAEFDRKYAGEIKNKLRSVLVKYPSPRRFMDYVDGEYVSYAPELTQKYPLSVNYPEYLLNDELPEGVTAPSTYFSLTFFTRYIGEKGKFREFLLEKYGRRARGFVVWSTHQAIIRLKTVFANYVLTWYALKQYKTPEERHQTALDLATYYSNVAFRGAAEIMHASVYDARVSNSEECEIANYVAQRVFELVMTIDDPVKMAEIKQEYHEILETICHRWIVGRRMEPYDPPLPPPAWWFREKQKMYREKHKKVWQEVTANKERCIND